MKRSIRAATAVLTVLAASTVLAGPSASAQTPPARATSPSGFVEPAIQQLYVNFFNRQEDISGALASLLVESNDIPLTWVSLQQVVSDNIVDDQRSVDGMAEVAAELYDDYFGRPHHFQRPATAKRTLRLLKR